MTRKVVRDDQDENNGTSRPGRDVLVRDGGPGVGLAGHLLLPQEPPLQHSATRAFKQPRLPLVTNGGLIAIGTDRYHILQRVGGHWSPLTQIATNVGSCWEMSEFRLQSFFWIYKVLVPDFGPGFSRLVPANTNTLIRRRIKQAQPSVDRNSNLPCGTRGKIGHQVNRCVIFWRQFFN